MILDIINQWWDRFTNEPLLYFSIIFLMLVGSALLAAIAVEQDDLDR